MITIISKDPERTWVVCNKCGEGYDVRKSGGCKCGNVQRMVDERGATMVIADDSDETFYDNEK